MGGWGAGVSTDNKCVSGTRTTLPGSGRSLPELPSSSLDDASGLDDTRFPLPPLIVAW